jgi:hypothetical protein
MGFSRSVKRFLVAYDYGQGAVWAFVQADSKEQIAREFPELTVADTLPEWMSRPELERLEREMTFDINDGGLLVDILEARHAQSSRRLSFIGIGRSGRSDTAERHEEVIREAFADKTARDV